MASQSAKAEAVAEITLKDLGLVPWVLLCVEQTKIRLHNFHIPFLSLVLAEF